MDKGQLRIIEVNQENEIEARRLILEGLKEHFGFIDHSLNPDLYPILKTYSGEKNVLMVGYHKGILTCTGALFKENEQIGRITRMSVAKDHRRKGFAKAMLKKLEERAKQDGYSELVLETNQQWISAIHLYKGLGYLEEYKDETSIHMRKELISVSNP